MRPQTKAISCSESGQARGVSCPLRFEKAVLQHVLVLAEQIFPPSLRDGGGHALVKGVDRCVAVERAQRRRISASCSAVRPPLVVCVRQMALSRSYRVFSFARSSSSRLLRSINRMRDMVRPPGKLCGFEGLAGYRPPEPAVKDLPGWPLRTGRKRNLLRSRPGRRCRAGRRGSGCRIRRWQTAPLRTRGPEAGSQRLSCPWIYPSPSSLPREFSPASMIRSSIVSAALTSSTPAPHPSVPRFDANGRALSTRTFARDLRVQWPGAILGMGDQQGTRARHEGGREARAAHADITVYSAGPDVAPGSAQSHMRTASAERAGHQRVVDGADGNDPVMRGRVVAFGAAGVAAGRDQQDPASDGVANDLGVRTGIIGPQLRLRACRSSC